MHGDEGLLVTGVVSIGLNVEDSSHINFKRTSRHQSLLKLLGCLEAEVSTVDVIFKREGKLSLVEVV